MNTKSARDAADARAGYALSSTSLGLQLTLLGPWNTESLSILESGGVASLRLNQACGWDGVGLEHARRAAGLLQLQVTRYGRIDAAAIEGVTTLRSLSLTGPLAHSIRWDCFPGLRELRLEPAVHLDSLAACPQLRALALAGLKRAELSFLEPLRELEDLLLAMTSLTTLQGLESCRLLRKLDLRSSAKLTEIDALGRLGELEELSLRSCRRLGNIDVLGELRKLVALELENCGRLDSVRFVERLAHLRRFATSGDTYVADGNVRFLSPIADRFELLHVPPRKHYDAKFVVNPVSGETEIQAP